MVVDTLSSQHWSVTFTVALSAVLERTPTKKHPNFDDLRLHFTLIPIYLIHKYLFIYLNGCGKMYLT
jgi:hypothetical protein